MKNSDSKFRWFAFEITDECNLECEYCYNVWLDKPQQKTNPLTLNDISKVLGNISAGEQPTGITLTGGEPLLRDDLSEIISLCAERKIKVAIATNGYLLTEPLTKKLISLGVEHFDIGFSKPNEYSKSAITQVAKTGKTVTASICINKTNHKRLDTIVRIASALGANAISLNRFIPTGRGKRNINKLTLNQSELLEALSKANQVAKWAGIYCFAGIPIEPCIRKGSDFSSLHFSTCQCGQSKWVIDSHGNLRTCEQNDKVLGNLKENSFNSVIKSKELEINRFICWRPKDECRACTINDKCLGGCRFRK